VSPGEGNMSVGLPRGVRLHSRMATFYKVPAQSAVLFLVVKKNFLMKRKDPEAEGRDQRLTFHCMGGIASSKLPDYESIKATSEEVSLLQKGRLAWENTLWLTRTGGMKNAGKKHPIGRAIRGSSDPQSGGGSLDFTGRQSMPRTSSGAPA